MERNIHYWVGTMNRVSTTKGDEKPVTNWDEAKSEWREVDEKEYTREYAKAWNIAENSFWHC